jgi:outer membrane protein
MAAGFAISITALAQTGSSAAALPSAPSAAASTADSPTPVAASGSKIGIVNLEQAIYACNEGQRDFQTLEKKLEPKQAELKSMSDELDGLKKQLSAQGDKLNEEAHNNLVTQISQKQKVFDRTMQDARDDAQGQQQEIAQKVLQKLGPLLVKYANDNGYGLIIDSSKPWPDGPVIIAGRSFDITGAIVQAYNTESGVAAPAASKPAATRPSGTTAKPATPSK